MLLFTGFGNQFRGPVEPSMNTPEMGVSSSDAAAEPSPPEGSSIGGYAPLLNGDFSQMAEEDRGRTTDGFALDFAWEYTVLDLSGDGEPELFVRVADEPAISRIFHEEDGVFYCWYFQDNEMNYTWEPLVDGTILVTYDYGGGISYTIYTLNSDGTRSEPKEVWYHRYDLLQPGDTIFWSHNDERLEEEIYFSLFQEAVESKHVTNWASWSIPHSDEKEEEL